MNSQEIKNSYVKLIHDAINKVGNQYFRIKVTNKCSEIRRERVFCYELYHCMRNLQLERSELDLTINGEIDKSGHPVILKDFNPDFVIHKQGTMDENQAVIEVKCNLGSKEAVKKDFQTINCMMNKYNYKNGFFILTGYNMNYFKIRMLPVLNFITKQEHNIYIFCKENTESKIEVFTLANLRK